jgi:hypothetical protein
MIWVTWAQHRREALVSGLILAVAGALLVITGVNMRSDFQSSGAASCAAAGGRAVGVFAAGTSCEPVLGAFSTRWYSLTLAASMALMSLPALLGVFLAAPLLSREFENGTHLLAWSQSITRGRWAWIKLGLIGAAVLVSAAGLATLVGWWHSPLDVAGYDGQWAAFDVDGLAPIAYAVFALALGTLAGLVVRRTIPAMALTLFVFAGVRLLLAQLRPHLLSPVTGSGMAVPQGSLLVVPPHYVDPQGHELSLDQVNGVMRLYRGGSSEGLMDYMRQHGANFIASYHPHDRFWTFQVIEAGIFLTLAVGLFIVSAWWLRKMIR